MSSYKQGGVYAITYDVWISGTKLGMDKKECITSIEIKETVEGSDSATITLQDPEFMYLEDNIFLEDNKIKIRIGWDSTSYRETFDGYISAIDINFDSNGIPKITITCMDNTHKMNRQKNNATFENCTSADVVKKIVRSYGFQCVIDSTYSFKKQETITQSNQTDIDFITQLAGNEVYPITARLVGNTFYYVKMGKLSTPKMTLTYKKYPHEVISFSPKINKESKQVEIDSASVSTSTKGTSSSTGTVSSSSKSSGGGSASSGETSSSKSSSGGYTYNPKTKSWSKK